MARPLLNVAKTHPFRQASSCLLPVEIRMQRFRNWPSSEAVMKPLTVGCEISAKLLSHRCWTHHAHLGSSLDFFNFDLGETFDLEKFPSCGSYQTLYRLSTSIMFRRFGSCKKTHSNSTYTICLELRNIRSINAWLISDRGNNGVDETCHDFGFHRYQWWHSVQVSNWDIVLKWLSERSLLPRHHHHQHRPILLSLLLWQTWAGQGFEGHQIVVRDVS